MMLEVEYKPIDIHPFVIPDLPGPNLSGNIVLVFLCLACMVIRAPGHDNHWGLGIGDTLRRDIALFLLTKEGQL